MSSIPPPSGPTAKPLKPRVLLVGEDARLREEAAAMLSLHATVAMSPTARRALDLVELEAFDVICADADMSTMSAPELFRKMMGTIGHVGFVMLATPSVYAASRADGRWHVLFKPLDAGKLVSAVLSLSRLTQMRLSVADLARARRFR